MLRVLAIFGVIALISSPQLAAAQPLAAGQVATPEAKALASALIDADGERERIATALAPMEPMFQGVILSNVASKDVGAEATVATVVHEMFSSIGKQLGDASVGAYTANFSPTELSAVLAFVRGPGGQAERANAPLLKADLRAALSAQAPAAETIEAAEAVFAKAPPTKRALIQRIFRAQNLEARTRAGYATLGAVMDAALVAATGGEPTKKAPPSSEAADKASQASDRYVRLVMAVEERFYVDRFNETDLATLADYLESGAGQAMLTRSPTVQRVLTKAMQEQFATMLPALSETVCSAITCSAADRAGLAAEMRSLAAMLPSVLGALG